MNNKFRDIAPVRTCKKKYKDYKAYKHHLRADFNNKCGYTNCSDLWFGGPGSFHIDHFKSKKKHPSLINKYSNLVYSCSYVNILKSDDDNTNYIDPCNTDFNLHFTRRSNGEILPVTVQAKYMHTKLKLYMKRYQVIWMLDKLKSVIDEIQAAIKNCKNKESLKSLHQLNSELSIEFHKYINYLNDGYDS